MEDFEFDYFSIDRHRRGNYKEYDFLMPSFISLLAPSLHKINICWSRIKNLLEMRNLSILIKKKWFKKIESGEKDEEYREIKWHWVTRLFYQKDKNSHVLKLFMESICRGSDLNTAMKIYGVEFKTYGKVLAVNGRNSKAPTLEFKYATPHIGTPKEGMCPPEDMGKILFILPVSKVKRLK